MDAAIDTETWLEQNTGWCERLRARVTLQQCKENRKRTRMMGEMEPGLKPCINCPGITPGQTMEKAKPKKKEGKGKMPASETEIYCQICGEKTKNAGRGLCAKHYQQAKKNGTAEKYSMYDAVKVGEESKEQREPVAEPESVSESNPKPEPEADPEPTQEDPLKGAELLTKTVSKTFSEPTATLANDCTTLYFNTDMLLGFGMKKYKYVYVHKKDERIFLELSNKKAKDAFKMTNKSREKKNSLASIGALTLSKKLGWKSGQKFVPKATTREDVIKLEEV